MAWRRELENAWRGDSRAGKSEFAMSLFKNPHYCEVGFSKEPDLRELDEEVCPYDGARFRLRQSRQARSP